MEAGRSEEEPERVRLETDMNYYRDPGSFDGLGVGIDAAYAHLLASRVGEDRLPAWVKGKLLGGSWKSPIDAGRAWGVFSMVERGAAAYGMTDNRGIRHSRAWNEDGDRRSMNGFWAQTPRPCEPWARCARGGRRRSPIRRPC